MAPGRGSAGGCGSGVGPTLALASCQLLAAPGELGEPFSEQQWAAPGGCGQRSGWWPAAQLWAAAKGL